MDDDPLLVRLRRLIESSHALLRATSAVSSSKSTDSAAEAPRVCREDAISGDAAASSEQRAGDAEKAALAGLVGAVEAVVAEAEGAGRMLAERGQAGRGYAGRGDAGRGDAGRGDAGRGEAGRGEAKRGEAGRGEAEQEEPDRRKCSTRGGGRGGRGNSWRGEGLDVGAGGAAGGAGGAGDAGGAGGAGCAGGEKGKNEAGKKPIPEIPADVISLSVEVHGWLFGRNGKGERVSTLLPVLTSLLSVGLHQHFFFHLHQQARLLQTSLLSSSASSSLPSSAPPSRPASAASSAASSPAASPYKPPHLRSRNARAPPPALSPSLSSLPPVLPPAAAQPAAAGAAADGGSMASVCPRALHAHWAELFPHSSAAAPRSSSASLLAPLLADPSPKVTWTATVRVAAAQTLASLLDSPLTLTFLHRTAASAPTPAAAASVAGGGSRTPGKRASVRGSGAVESDAGGSAVVGGAAGRAEAVAAVLQLEQDPWTLSLAMLVRRVLLTVHQSTPIPICPHLRAAVAAVLQQEQDPWTLSLACKLASLLAQCTPYHRLRSTPRLSHILPSALVTRISTLLSPGPLSSSSWSTSMSYSEDGISTASAATAAAATASLGHVLSRSTLPPPQPPATAATTNPSTITFTCLLSWVQPCIPTAVRVEALQALAAWVSTFPAAAAEPHWPDLFALVTATLAPPSTPTKLNTASAFFEAPQKPPTKLNTASASGTHTAVQDEDEAPIAHPDSTCSLQAEPTLTDRLHPAALKLLDQLLTTLASTRGAGVGGAAAAGIAGQAGQQQHEVEVGGGGGGGGEGEEEGEGMRRQLKVTWNTRNRVPPACAFCQCYCACPNHQHQQQQEGGVAPFSSATSPACATAVCAAATAATAATACAPPLTGPATSCCPATSACASAALPAAVRTASSVIGNDVSSSNQLLTRVPPPGASQWAEVRMAALTCFLHMPAPTLQYLSHMHDVIFQPMFALAAGESVPAIQAALMKVFGTILLHLMPALAAPHARTVSAAPHARTVSAAPHARTVSAAPHARTVSAAPHARTVSAAPHARTVSAAPHARTPLLPRPHAAASSLLLFFRPCECRLCTLQSYLHNVRSAAMWSLANFSERLPPMHCSLDQCSTIHCSSSLRCSINNCRSNHCGNVQSSRRDGSSSGSVVGPQAHVGVEWSAAWWGAAWWSLANAAVKGAGDSDKVRYGSAGDSETGVQVRQCLQSNRQCCCESQQAVKGEAVEGCGTGRGICGISKCGDCNKGDQQQQIQHCPADSCCSSRANAGLTQVVRLEPEAARTAPAKGGGEGGSAHMHRRREAAKQAAASAREEVQGKESSYGVSGAWQERVVEGILSCALQSNPKVQWSVCAALSLFLQNPSVHLPSSPWTGPVLATLQALLQRSSNFKIRIHAAAALIQPCTRADYGPEFGAILHALVSSLSSLDAADEQSAVEQRYKPVLRDQIAATLLHMTSLASPQDLCNVRQLLQQHAECISHAVESARSTALRALAHSVPFTSISDKPLASTALQAVPLVDPRGTLCTHQQHYSCGSASAAGSDKCDGAAASDGCGSAGRDCGASFALCSSASRVAGMCACCHVKLAATEIRRLTSLLQDKGDDGKIV
ncbi:unnamed protein product [Closterium sp. NIES-64]|nr:unnamed protein product [Closterium sp. NIES-64]